MAGGGWGTNKKYHERGELWEKQHSNNSDIAACPRCPVATLFVLWEKGDNDGVRPRMKGCSAPGPFLLPALLNARGHWLRYGL